jgi:tRNA pseudouridine synthase 9
VTAAHIGIVHEDAAMMVIDKPAGVPVHPAGRYFHNSVVEILRAERRNAPEGPLNPLPCNRLDRLTSGIMFVAKNPRAADALCEQLKRRTLRKEYIARVAGEFPEGSVVCNQPVLVISPKLGLNAVRASGKQAVTVFRRLAYYPPADDPDTSPDAGGGPPGDGMDWKRLRGHSIVRCFPLTGRTHQLRVHLQFLGHPIANDPIYANRRVFGAALGRGRDTHHADDDIITALSRMGKDEVADAVAYHDGLVGDFLRRRAERLTGELCAECAAPLYSDPGAHEMGMFLHARRYACAAGAWAYETPGLPAWALPPEGRDGPRGCGPESEPLDVDFSLLKIEEDIPMSKAEKDRRRENGGKATE